MVILEWLSLVLALCSGVAATQIGRLSPPGYIGDPIVVAERGVTPVVFIVSLLHDKVDAGVVGESAALGSHDDGVRPGRRARGRSG
jgi:hypothetical protein